MRTLSIALLFFLLPCTCVLAQQFRVLLVTETGGWHHTSIVAAVPALQQLAERNAFDLEWQQNGMPITAERLAAFDVLLFINTTGDILNDEEQTAVEQFMAAGNGFVGVHAAADTEYDWPWYTEMIGHMFKIHPHQQSAMLDVVDNSFPGLTGWPARKLWTDEYYEFLDGKRRPGFNYLITVDESSYETYAKWGDNESVPHGDFHPVSWYRPYAGGRMFYTSLGHIPAIYQDAAFLDHLMGGIYYAATGKR